MSEGTVQCLIYMLAFHVPMLGEQQAAIPCVDLPFRSILCGGT